MNSFSILFRSGIIGIILFGILFSFIAFLLIRANKRKFKRRDKIFKEYRQSLSELRNNPNNAALKERTIMLGRAFSDLTLDKNLNRKFDELALMNEINAVSGVKPNPAPAQSVEFRLKQLEDLRSKQLITDSEYISRRQKLINEI
jgi:hypothetical protein